MTDGVIPFDRADPAGASKRHETWIASRTIVFLEGFFMPADEEIQKRRIREWVEVLKPLSAEAINAGMIDYHRNGPRAESGALRRPAAGDVYQRAKRHEPRPKRSAVSIPAWNRSLFADILRSIAKDGEPATTADTLSGRNSLTRQEAAEWLAHLEEKKLVRRDDDGWRRTTGEEMLEEDTG